MLSEHDLPTFAESIFSFQERQTSKPGSGEFPDKYAYGETPSIAFQKLAGIVKAANEAKVPAKVLRFAKAA